MSGARHRKVVCETVASGVPGLPDMARFVYEEWFRRLSDDDLVRVRYNYNYFDLVRGGWRGYHLHQIEADGPSIPHAKCVGSDGSGDPAAHYFAYEVDLWAAHDEFEALYMAQQPISCLALQPIR